MQTEYQEDLNGKRSTTPPTIPVMTGMLRDGIFAIFSQKDSIWRTFKFFYNAYLEGIPCLIRENIEMAHLKDFQVSPNTITNNIKRLLRNQLISIITTNAGKTRCAYKYRITEKGLKWFNLALNQDVMWAKEL